MVEQHARRRERVQREEPRARDQRERHEEQARVRSPMRGLARDERERDVDQRDREDEQEVRRMVLPHDVDARDGQEQGEPDERQRQQRAEEPDPRAVLHVSSMDRRGAGSRSAREARARGSERTSASG